MNDNHAFDNHAGSNGRTTPLDQYSTQPNQHKDDSPFYRPAAPSITLPKGGGALKGIDEKFSVNAVNGTASLDIQLPLTPGREGFTPALGITYSSGSGNSVFGLGWNLSLPSIQRRTDKRLPEYCDTAESDVFLLAGAEDLVPELDEYNNRIIITSGDYSVKRYIPRIEGMFARIEFISKANTSDCWWRVTTKDNITTYFGLDATARITDPQQPERIFKWLPQISVDHKGNVQHFTYIAEDIRNLPSGPQERNRINGTAPFANTYLKSVRYCNETPYFIGNSDIYEPTLPGTGFLMEAVLDYGDHSSEFTVTPDQDWPSRYDAFSDFHAGFEIRTYRRCTRVMMYHYFSELDGKNLVRTLQLQYQNDITTPAPVLTEADTLVFAVQKGYEYKNGSWHSKALPKMSFGYQPLQWDKEITRVDRKNFTHAPEGLNGPYQWTDFDGEGISGILTESGGGWFYKNNLGDGHFTDARLIAQKPSFKGLSSGNLQWTDLDADGRRQVVSNGQPKGFWELGPDGEGSQEDTWQSFHTFPNNINIDWNSPFTKMLDLNGDGRPDAIVTEDRAWTWYENEGKEGWETGGNSRIFFNEEKGPVLMLRDPVQCIFLADMNGDGMTDLVRIKNGEVCYWPNMGYGKFGAKVTMKDAPRFTSPDMYDPKFLTLADISGTGAADLLYITEGKCTAWINYSGNGWSEGEVIGWLPSTEQFSKIAVLDFLGKGTGCIVWSSPLPQYADAPLRYIDLMGGNKPYLMNSYSNGLGKTVSINYKSSTLYYLADKLAGIPWATKLPFPVHCISSITTQDSVSNTGYTQTYKYRHGYYDHEEREFRGFGYVETNDADSAFTGITLPVADTSLDQAPVITKTWYHTGAWLRESVLTDQFMKEYFQFEGWDDVTVVAGFTATDMNAQEVREAHRALKGLVLRQEIYAQDGSVLEDNPYTVAATAYTVKRIQKTGDNRYAVFFTHQQQNISYTCERNITDPRIHHQFALETDQWGNVTKSADVVYPRRHTDSSLEQIVRDEQARMHISYTETTFTNDAADYDHYHLRMPAEVSTWEVVGVSNPYAPALWMPGDIATICAGATEIDFSANASGTAERRLISVVRTLYKNNAADTSLALGVLESLAIRHENYQLAYTGTLRNYSFDAKVDHTMLEQGGFTDLDSNGNFWLPSGTMSYTDPQQRFYTADIYTDPWGYSTQVNFWGSYWLLPESVTDPKNNVNTVIAYDWRIMQPARICDANINYNDILYDELGMPVAMAFKGKDDGTEGDSLDGLDIYSNADVSAQSAFFTTSPVNNADVLLQNATWRCVYNLDSLPLTAGMIARQHHVNNPLIVSGQSQDRMLRLTYTDGLGRVIMHKALCEGTLENSGQTWTGSGRKIYNNKGNAVMQFEPYFSASHHCDTAEQAASQGVSPKLHYDSQGRTVRTDMPDGTFSKTEWTVWKQSTFDSNDTVTGSDWYVAIQALPATGATPDETADIQARKDAAAKAALHNNTPSVVHTDTLGRPFFNIQYDSAAGDPIYTYAVFDIAGNRVAVIDGNRYTGNPAGDIPAIHYRFNMLKQVCYQHSIDSGENYTLTDVTGQPLYAWNADNRKFTMKYDELRRVTEKRLDDDILIEVISYGEDMSSDTILNLRGRVYEHFDGSGRTWMPQGYDFKGHPVQTAIQLLTDRILTDADWSSNPGLNLETLTTTVQTDALSRPVRITDAGANITEYVYERSGALQQVRVNGESYADDIHYDAKGQRQAIWFSNGTKTGYTYDPKTFRLVRLLTVNVNSSSSYYNDVLQDLNYYYDPVGNITSLRDKAQQTIFFSNTVVSPAQSFTYDALYRLLQAQGREKTGLATFGNTDNFSDKDWTTTHPGDGNAVQSYTQYYSYDAVGNILKLQHNAVSGGYTRNYSYNTANNQLKKTHVDRDYGYSYDDRGNMNAMPHLKNMFFNAQNELYYIDNGDTTKAAYQYSSGQRMRKYVQKDGSSEERIYLGAYEIYRAFDNSGSLVLERATVHVNDGAGRIAMLEVRTQGSDGSPASLKRFIYTNHSGSASLELNETSDVISYEEYHPYGTTAYQAMSATISAVAKRYRYTGKERDEESGLYYNSARYYIPWLCRWSACDPINTEWYNLIHGNPERNHERQHAELAASSYEYCYDNPVRFTDPTGEQPPVNFNRPLIQPDKLRIPPVIIPDPNASKKPLKPVHSSYFGKAVQMLGGEPYKYIIHYRPKDGKDNIVKVETIYSLHYIPSGSVWSIPTVRPKVVQFIKEDAKGNQVSHTGEIPLKNFGSTLYVGPWNPKYASNTHDETGYHLKDDDRYDYPAVNSLDAAAKKHDLAYDKVQAVGATSAIGDLNTINADKQLVKDAATVMTMYLLDQTDPVNNQKISKETYDAAVRVFKLFSTIVAEKTARIEAAKAAKNTRDFWDNQVVRPINNFNENAWRMYIH